MKGDGEGLEEERGNERGEGNAERDEGNEPRRELRRGRGRPQVRGRPINAFHKKSKWRSATARWSRPLPAPARAAGSCGERGFAGMVRMNSNESAWDGTAKRECAV